MKKTYIIPAVLMTTTETENMIAASSEGFNSTLGSKDTDGVSGEDLLVKRHNYSVWDEDWSQNESE